ncbi:MAG: hypothetical protein JXR88_05090, partial [Clostridia bacterium]|nr:hypothetical protein [Clostridia bacterium]
MNNLFDIAFFLLFGLILTYFTSRDMCLSKKNTILWFLGFIFRFCIVICVFLMLGTSLDKIVWTDTVAYFNKSILLCDGKLSVIDYVSGLSWPPHVGYEIFISLIYKMFGISELIPNLINAIFVQFIAYLTYKISNMFYSNKVSIISSFLVVFYPLYIHFSVFILKDIAVATLFLLSVYNGLDFLVSRRKVSIIYFAFSILILFYFRSFFSMFLLFWMFISMIVNTYGKSIYSKIIIVVGCALSFGVSSNIIKNTKLGNIGYTIGGSAMANTSLSFIELQRIEFSVSSMIKFMLSLIKGGPLFVKHIIIMTSFIITGPYYWASQSGAELFFKYNRFVLFENLGTIYMLLFIPLLVFFIIEELKLHKHNHILVLVVIIYIAVIIAGDFRWKLAMMPLLFIFISKGYEIVRLNRTFQFLTIIS